MDKKENTLLAKADAACARYMADLFNERKERAYKAAQKRLDDYRQARANDKLPQVIRSLNRPQAVGYFIAIHSFTAFFGEKSKARKFHSHQDALEYAHEELFTDERAFCIEPA